MGRAFGFLSLILGLGIGMYIYSRQLQSTTNPATGAAATPQATINLTGVRMDLTSIAQTERRYFATEGKYGTLDEMIESHYISVARQRPPYSYEVQIGSSGFRVVATRAGDDKSGSPAQISVDENLEFQTEQ
jgi:hypothetical protein